jgi:hypothetical protein
MSTLLMPQMNRLRSSISCAAPPFTRLSWIRSQKARSKEQGDNSQVTKKTKQISDRMKGRDWLMTQDWSDEEIELALDTANQLKEEFRSGVPTLHLPHKTLFLIFFDKST